MLFGWVLLQAASAIPPVDFDLARIPPQPRRCGEGAGGEIVVCAGTSDRERIVILPPATEPMLPRAEMRLFGKVSGGLVADPRTVGGFPSNSIKATVKVPF